MKTLKLPSVASITLTFLALSALLASGGCHEDAMVTNLKYDDAYIRMPEELAVGSVHPAAGDPFPVHAGNHWTMRVTGMEHPGTEEITDLGPTTVDGHPGEILEVRPADSKAPRQEIYANTGSELDLVASGLHSELMQMSPSIPLFHLPIKQGDSISWDGVLHFKNMSSGASALSRVSGATKVETPAGTFAAYRIDTMITTTVEGRAALFPMTRWVAPGIGLVQERVLVGKSPVLKQLVSYHVEGKN